MEATTTLQQFAENSSFGVDLGATNWSYHSSLDGRSTHSNRGRSTDFTSLEALLEHCFKDLGYTPTSACLACAGTDKDGRFALTNLPWDSFLEEELKERFGLNVLEIINDMQGALLGAGGVNRKLLTPLKRAEGKLSKRRHVCVLTLSTGLNICVGTSDPAWLGLAREFGHIMLAMPRDQQTIGAGFANWTEDVLGMPASIENLLSGGQGVSHMVDYLVPLYGVSREVWLEIVRSRRAGEGLGRLMTEGALAGETFWVAAAKLYGELLGYLINQIVVDNLVGELFIQGSVLNGTPGFAQWLFDNTAVGETLIGAGMEKDFVAREVAIFGIPPHINLATEGTERRARALLETLDK